MATLTALNTTGLLKNIGSASLRFIKTHLSAKEQICIVRSLFAHFPQLKSCDLFESILQTKWPELIKTVPGVNFDAYRNKHSPNISTVVWQFPNSEAKKNRAVD